MNADAVACSAAASMSASSQTTSGFFPPSSRQTFARTPRALTRCWIDFPVAADPVKLTRPTRGSSTSGVPTSGPRPCTAEYRPRGRPASHSSFPNATAVYGVSSCDFATTALPHNSAGNVFHATPASGLLNGMIAAHTPIGARSVRTLRFATGLVIVLP